MSATDKVKAAISEALEQAGISVEQVHFFEPEARDMYVPVMLVRVDEMQQQQQTEIELRKACDIMTGTIKSLFEKIEFLEADRAKLIRTIQILAGPDSPRTSTEGFDQLFAPPPPPPVQGPLGSYGPCDFYPSCVCGADMSDLKVLRDKIEHNYWELMDARQEIASLRQDNEYLRDVVYEEKGNAGNRVEPLSVKMQAIFAWMEAGIMPEVLPDSNGNFELAFKIDDEIMRFQLKAGSLEYIDYLRRFERLYQHPLIIPEAKILREPGSEQLTAV